MKRLAALLFAAAFAAGCPVLREPDELLEESNLRVIVTSVPAGNEVRFDIGEQHGSAFSHEDELVEFHFTLEPGTYDASIVMLRDGVPGHCGDVTVDVEEGDHTFSVDAHNIEPCDAVGQ